MLKASPWIRTAVGASPTTAGPAVPGIWSLPSGHAGPKMDQETA